MQKECLSDPKKLVPLLNRKLYEKGDCYSPGTGFCIKKDYKVYLAPAESNPDLLDEDDIFTFNEMLDENGNPDVDVAPTDSSLEPSKYSKLYLHLLEEFSCNCVLLVESQSAKMVADLYSDSLVFSNVECLTNIVSTVTKEKLRACDSLTIPIIPYKQPQEELISDLINALYSNTSTCCCIIKGFGMIFLGDCWKSVRSMLETVKQLLEYELNILQYRIREELVRIFKTLPHKPDFDNHRNVHNEEICEDDLILEDRIDETSEISPKAVPSQSNLETVRLPHLMNRTTFNSDHSTGYLDYWPSFNNINKTDEPFIGKTSKGFEKTYNIKGNFKNMLSIMEILMYLAPGNPKKGLELLEIEIKNDKEMAIIWAKKGRKENEELTPYHFRWAGYFNKVQKWMRNHHKIKLKDNFKSKKCKKKETFYAKLSSGVQ